RAVEVLQRGRQLAAALPWQGDLGEQLDEELESAQDALAAARRAASARQLHALAERIRFASALDPLPRDLARDLAKRCRAVWQVRHQLLRPERAEQLRPHLLHGAVITPPPRGPLGRPPGRPAPPPPPPPLLGSAPRLSVA